VTERNSPTQQCQSVTRPRHAIWYVTAWRYRITKSPFGKEPSFSQPIGRNLSCLPTTDGLVVAPLLGGERTNSIRPMINPPTWMKVSYRQILYRLCNLSERHSICWSGEIRSKYICAAPRQPKLLACAIGVPPQHINEIVHG
jgi:hypothetical protein